MPLHSSLRMPRRPQAYIVFVCFLVFLLALANYDDTLSLDPLPSFRQSPYYVEDDSHYYTWTTPAIFPPLKESQKEEPIDLCKNFPTHLLDKVQIVMKTGTGESAETKAHLDTASSCMINILVLSGVVFNLYTPKAYTVPSYSTNILGFSDLEETIGEHQFIDILADLPPSYHNHPDFAAYSAQKQAHSEGRPVEYSAEGWKLDRFKFLPMVDKAYQMRPRADCPGGMSSSRLMCITFGIYFFAHGTDHKLCIDTLFRLLCQLDPSKPHYLGSPAAGRDGTYFAYGGAGFVLSRGLMKRLMADSTQLSVQYQGYAENDCCGDAALGYAIMNQTGVRLEALYPTFAGDELAGVKVNQEKWCIPLLALHRISPEQMKSLWTWERTRAYDQLPFTNSTILDYTLADIHQTPERASWDNFVDVIQPDDSPAHSSSSQCSSACTSDPGCLEYSYSPGTCRFEYFAQMGRPVSESDHISGWDVEKVYRLGYQKDPKRSTSCKDATWAKPILGY